MDNNMTKQLDGNWLVMSIKQTSEVFHLNWQTKGIPLTVIAHLLPHLENTDRHHCLILKKLNS